MALDRSCVKPKSTNSFEKTKPFPLRQTVILKTQPYLKVTATEDDVTKYFYKNNRNTTVPTGFDRSNRNTKINSNKTDDLEDKEQTGDVPKIADGKRTTPLGYSSFTKSTSKTCAKKRNDLLKFKSNILAESLSSLKTKQSSFNYTPIQKADHFVIKNKSSSRSNPNNIDTNEVSDTSKLHDQHQTIVDNNRSSRLRYSTKNYDQENHVPMNISKSSTKLLSKHLSHTRPAQTRQQQQLHVSWSPVKEYIYQESNGSNISTQKRKRSPSKKAIKSCLSTRSSHTMFMNCSQEKLSLSTPDNIHFRSSRSTEYLSPSPSIDLYYTPLSSECSLIDELLVLPESFDTTERNENTLKVDSSDSVHQRMIQHEETMQRYNELLKKMKSTDEQLRTLSRSWTHHIQQQSPGDKQLIVSRQEAALPLTITPTSRRGLLSPMVLQMCLLSLVIFNLLFAFFFNQINVWWSEHFAPAIFVEHHDEETLNL